MTAIIVFILILLLLVSGALASAWLVQWSWNLLLVGVFHWPAITFWQGLAVVVLLGMIRGLISVTVNQE